MGSFRIASIHQPSRAGLLLVSLLLLLWIAGGCSNGGEGGAGGGGASHTDQADQPRQSELESELSPAKPELPKPETQTITLAAIGDVLIHKSIYKDALKEGVYNFMPMIEEVVPYLASADIAFANQETVIGGTEIGLSDYPRFNSPKELGDALQAAGIDVVSMANNHSLDRGYTALENAEQHWTMLGVCTAGISLTPEDEGSCILEVKGVRLAVLAYTYGTNGIPLPKDKPYLVHLLNEARLQADIQKARQEADAVIVSMHFGAEYRPLPDQSQLDWAELAASAGADLIIGHHPHVLQPFAWLDKPDGGKTLVVYSLGNFLAAQEANKAERRTGGIMTVEMRITPELRLPAELSAAQSAYSPAPQTIPLSAETPAAVEFGEVRFIPTYIQYENWRNFRVTLLPDDSSTQNSRYTEVKNHMSRWMPELIFGGSR